MRQSLRRSLSLPPEPGRKSALDGRHDNQVKLAGRVLERGILRFSPAGIPVIDFQIAHESRQDEGGVVRQVECLMACVAVGPPALLLKEISVGAGIVAKGFLSARSLKQKQAVLHATQIEFIEDI